jgi:AcrR family transcriptional regulator
MSLSAQQREERRERILAAARALVSKQGHESVTMREIAAQASVSVPTLYSLFDSKRVLLLAATDSHIHQSLAATLPEKATGLDRILALVENMGPEIIRQSDQSRAMIDTLSGHADDSPTQDLIAAAIAQILRSALEQMKQRRQLVAWVDPAVLAQQVTSNLFMTTFGWARGAITDRQLPRALVFATAIMLLGVARGSSVRALEALARDHQGAALIEPSS